MMSDALRANVQSVWRQGTGQEEAPPGGGGANWRKLLSGAAPSLVMLFRGSVSARFHHLCLNNHYLPPRLSCPDGDCERQVWQLRAYRGSATTPSLTPVIASSRDNGCPRFNSTPFQMQPNDGLFRGNPCVLQYRVVDRGEKALRCLKNTVEDWIHAGEAWAERHFIGLM
jgi:hypothetical protein